MVALAQLISTTRSTPFEGWSFAARNQTLTLVGIQPTREILVVKPYDAYRPNVDAAIDLLGSISDACLDEESSEL